ncbi:MAG: hypothetical protein ABI419_00530 [Ginsengibacter sp.]
MPANNLFDEQEGIHDDLQVIHTCIIVKWQPFSVKKRYTFLETTMKRELKKNILFIFIAIVLFACIGGYLVWNRPHQDVKGANAIETTSIDLYKIFTSEPLVAKSKYLNTITAVSGEIIGISLNQKNQQILLLKTQTSGASVNCTMEENIDNARAGDTIALKGICIGYIEGDSEMGLPGDVYLIRCYRSI